MSYGGRYESRVLKIARVCGLDSVLSEIRSATCCIERWLSECVVAYCLTGTLTVFFVISPVLADRLASSSAITIFKPKWRLMGEPVGETLDRVGTHKFKL